MAPIIAVTGIFFFAMSGGGLAYAAAKLHLYNLADGIDFQIGHPNRLFICAGLTYGAAFGVIVCGVTGCLKLFTYRFARCDRGVQ